MTDPNANTVPDPGGPDEPGGEKTAPVVPGAAPRPEDLTPSFELAEGITLSDPDLAQQLVRGLPRELAEHPRYRILAWLGAGGMGTVFKAEHRVMDRVVALKIVHPSLVNRPAMVERFHREVKAAARLSHPNIVAAYDADQAGGTHFLVMEFVEGVDLDRVIRERGALPLAEACEYARETAVGLQHAWERGMVHRDIKPHNLMRTPDGRIKILDFGLARLVSEYAPESGVAGGAPAGGADPNRLIKGTTYAYTGMGTADYIAPEEAVDARRADTRADIYSLGCTLYRFLAGRVPFPDGGMLDKLRAHLARPPEPLARLRPEVPGRLVGTVERMMAKDPADRFQTPAEVAAALAPFARAARPPVLVVDDDETVRQAMGIALEGRGYPVSYAADGHEALERLRQGPPPGLVLLDLMMPGMDGWEFLRRQKEDPGLAAIPVVIISAASSQQAEAIALGAADYLQKPVAIDELAERVQGIAATG